MDSRAAPPGVSPANRPIPRSPAGTALKPIIRGDTDSTVLSGYSSGAGARPSSKSPAHDTQECAE